MYDSGVTSKISKEAQLVMQPPKSTNSVRGLSQSNVLPVPIQDGTCLLGGRKNLKIEHKFLNCLPHSYVLTGGVHRWLYCLFLAIDANFRLKLKARGIKDPELGPGLAYFVDTAKFQKPR